MSTQLPNLQRSQIKLNKQAKSDNPKPSVNFTVPQGMPTKQEQKKMTELQKNIVGATNRFPSPKFLGNKAAASGDQAAFIPSPPAKGQQQLNGKNSKSNQAWISYDQQNGGKVGTQSTGFQPQSKSQHIMHTPVPQRGGKVDDLAQDVYQGYKQPTSPIIYQSKGSKIKVVAKQNGKATIIPQQQQQLQSRQDPLGQIAPSQTTSFENLSPVKQQQQQDWRTQLIQTPTPKRTKYQTDNQGQGTAAAPGGYSQSQSNPWDSTAGSSQGKGAPRFFTEQKDQKKNESGGFDAQNNNLKTSQFNAEGQGANANNNMRNNAHHSGQMIQHQTGEKAPNGQSYLDKKSMEQLASNVQPLSQQNLQSSDIKSSGVNSQFQNNNQQDDNRTVVEAPIELEKYTLVLDMDETLLHFNHIKRFYRPRPHVHEFLREMSQYYHLIVFTAGMKDYADWLLNDLDKQRLIKRRLYRQQCVQRRGVYMKDLKKIKSDLKKTIIIDNIPENFSMQPDNGVPIRGWFNDNPNDTELVRIGAALKQLVINQVPDVRVCLREFLRRPPMQQQQMMLNNTGMGSNQNPSAMRFAKNNAVRNQSVVSQGTAKKMTTGLGVPQANMLQTGGNGLSYQRYLAQPQRQQPRMVSSSAAYGLY